MEEQRHLEESHDSRCEKFRSMIDKDAQTDLGII